MVLYFLSSILNLQEVKLGVFPLLPLLGITEVKVQLLLVLLKNKIQLSDFKDSVGFIQ